MKESLQSKKELLDKLKNYFQLSLALCDKCNAVKYQEKYRDTIYSLALDIAINIQQPEYVECLKEKEDAIFSIIYSKIFIAIILQQKDHIKNFDYLKKILNRKYIKIQDIEISPLISKTQQELISKYKEQWLSHYDKYDTRNLIFIGEDTNDIGIAKYILEYFENNNKSTKKNILSNIVRLSGKLNSKYISKNYTNKISENHIPLFSDGYTEQDLKYDLQKYQFNKAIKIYYKDPIQAQKIIDSLGTNYVYLFKAFLAYENNDIATIISFVEELNSLPDTITFKITPNYDKKAMKDYFSLYANHDQIILEIARMIAKKYPSISDEILSKTRSLRACSLDVQVDIAISYFEKNHTKGLKYIRNLDVEEYKKIALEELIYLYDDKEVLKELLPILDTFETPAFKYEILYLLNQKIKIPFNLLMEVSNEIMPYDDYLQFTNYRHPVISNEKDFFELSNFS